DRPPPGRRLSRFLLLRRCRAIAGERPRILRRFRLDLRRGRRHNPRQSDPPDPVERPLDAAGIARPGAVPRDLRPEPDRRRSAVRIHRRDRLAARLGDWARGRGVGAGLDWSRDPDGLSGPDLPVHGPARQLLPLPAVDRGGVAPRCPWPEGAREILRPRGLARWSGDPGPPRWRSFGRRG